MVRAWNITKSEISEENMSKHNAYNNYFSDHYGYSFSKIDLDTHRKWFTSQWNTINDLHHVSKYRNDNVLEIGSSIGGFMQFLSDNDCTKVEGIELDQDACNFSQDSFPDYIFHNTSLEKFKTKKKYDAIFSFEVLEHVNDPLEALEKICSLLSENGVFIGTSPYPYPKNIHADETHMYVLHPENWRKLFQKAGFKHIYTLPCSYFPRLWRVHSKLNIRIPTYLPFPHFISTTLIMAVK